MEQQLDYICTIAVSPLPFEYFESIESTFEKDMNIALEIKKEMYAIFTNMEKQMRQLNMDEDQWVRFQTAKKSISTRWGFDDSNGLYCIESLLHQMTESAKPLTSKKLIRFEMETSILTLLQKENLAEKHQRLLENGIERLGQSLTELPANFTCPSELKPIMTFISQWIRVLTPFIKLPAIHQACFKCLEKDLYSLVDEYQHFILKQQPDFLKKNASHFEAFEHVLYKLSTLHPKQKVIDKKLLDVYQARINTANSKKHINFREYITMLKQERVIREQHEKAIDEEEDNLIARVNQQIAFSRSIRQNQMENIDKVDSYLKSQRLFPHMEKSTGTEETLGHTDDYSLPF